MDAKNRIPFYQWIHEMSGTDIAEQAGLSQPTISNAIRRNKTSLRTRQKIAQVFGVQEIEVFPNDEVEIERRK